MAESDDDIVKEGKKRFSAAVDWESVARPRGDYDYKFANADAHNLYQWEMAIYNSRQWVGKPCLTINKTKTHCLQVINDAKQNKPGVNVRPVGENASFEAAQIFMEVIRHIEYVSNAESVYDNATMFQVQRGIGYWRVVTEAIDTRSFDQEIYIRPIKDPNTVYLDPDISQADGSDARFGFIFEDMPRDLFDEKYPEYKNEIGWGASFDGFDGNNSLWLNRDNVRVAEYYRKTQKKEKLVTFIHPERGHRITAYMSELDELGKAIFKQIKNNESQLPWQNRTYNERNVVTDNVEWFKIAGNSIIDRGPWLGKYIPIVRVVGEETVIDGVWDVKGLTRTLLDPQRMYNFNSSAEVEFISVQTKSPYTAPAEAIEGHEEEWANLNTRNPALLTYNQYTEDGKELREPKRIAPPQPSQGHVTGMQIAQNEMMMATGQYQSQFGEAENAKSGVAINARQRQGDRATYHFIDNQAVAIRFTGKILIDLIPKVYDTERVIRMSASDGSILNVKIDPNAKVPYQKINNPEGPQMDKRQQMVDIIFNPNVGMYDVISEVGPSFATRRQEAFNALTQIAAQNKEFMGIAGDILWKVADFPEAQVLAERWRKIIPKNITGDAMDPAIEQAMEQAANKIEQLLAVITKQTQELADKDKEADIRAYQAETNRKIAAADANRKDYEAETDRLLKLGNSENLGQEIKPVISQLIAGMVAAGEPPSGGLGEVEPVEDGLDSGAGLPANGGASMGDGGGEQPPMPGAQKAPDGQWYVENPQSPGSWLRVDNAEPALSQ